MVEQWTNRLIPASRAVSSATLVPSTLMRRYSSGGSAAVGSPPPKLRFPYWLFFGGAMLCEALCAPFGIEPPLHRRRVRFFRNNRAFSIEKARERLGYAPQVSLEEGMARTVAWYRENGYL